MGNVLQADDLERAVAGDLSALSLIEAEPHSRLRALSHVVPTLAVDAHAASSVLRQLRAREITSQQAQRWASFVRRGYIAGHATGPVKPIDINFDPGAEDEIAEVISRLDELGDEVDGTIDDAEIAALLSALEVHSTPVPAARH
jgi:hypothetical protein